MPFSTTSRFCRHCLSFHTTYRFCRQSFLTHYFTCCLLASESKDWKAMPQQQMHQRPAAPPLRSAKKKSRGKREPSYVKSAMPLNILTNPPPLSALPIQKTISAWQIPVPTVKLSLTSQRPFRRLRTRKRWRGQCVQLPGQCVQLLERKKAPGRPVADRKTSGRRESGYSASTARSSMRQKYNRSVCRLYKYYQCCEWVKNQNPGPGWTSRIIFPRA